LPDIDDISIQHQYTRIDTVQILYELFGVTAVYSQVYI